MVRDDQQQVAELVLCERRMMEDRNVFEIIERTDTVDFNKGIVDVRITLRIPVSTRDNITLEMLKPYHPVNWAYLDLCTDD